MTISLGGGVGEMMGVAYNRKATDENRNPAQKLHLSSPNQIPAAEAALDSNASETELFLGQRHPVISADQPSRQPMPDIENK